MARSWLKYVAILAALVAGTICSTALADGGRLGGGIRLGGNSSGGSSSSVSPRMGVNSGGRNGGIMRTPAPRVTNGNVGGNFGGQVLNKTGGTVLTKPPMNAGPKLPIVSKLPIVGNGNGGGGGGPKIGPIVDKGGGLKINPIGGKIGGGKIGGGKIGDGKIGGGITIFPKAPILGNKHHDHGHHHGHGHSHVAHCDPFKPGCHPWWFCPSWVTPAPVVYAEPIIVPVSVPAAPVVVAAPAQPSTSTPAAAETPASTETAKPVTTTPEEKPQQVPLGSTLVLQAKELGEQAGQVIIQIEKIAMPALVSDWSASSVTATLPTVAIAENLRAELLLVRADGQIASSVKVELTPALPPVTEDAKLAGDPASALLPTALNP